jgi:hypothetical protein
MALISDEDYDRLAETLKAKFGKTFEVGAQRVDLRGTRRYRRPYRHEHARNAHGA